MHFLQRLHRCLRNRCAIAVAATAMAVARRDRRGVPRAARRHLPELSRGLPARRNPLQPGDRTPGARHRARSEEHTSELQSLMRISYAVFCLKKKTQQNTE